LTLALVVAGTVGLVRRRELPIVAASVAIVLANCALHVLYGNDYVLYALHWEAALLVLLSGLALLPGRGRVAGVALLVAFLGVEAASSWALLSWLFAQLAAAAA
jgi:hypothetical protein